MQTKRKLSVVLFLLMIVLFTMACQWSWWQNQWQSESIPGQSTPTPVYILTMAAFAETQYAGTPYIK